MAGMIGRLSALAILLAAAPGWAQEVDEQAAGRETCAEVSLDGDFRLKIPCPPGTRGLLQQLPRPADPAPRRDIVIDPEWPHDQAMVAEHDWSHDWAMVVPQADEEAETIPLFDDLLKQFGPFMSRNPQGEGDQGEWYFEKEIDGAAE